MAESGKGQSTLLLLKWPLLALVLGLLASGLFVASSVAYLKQEQANEKSSQRALADAKARIGNANKEIQDLLASVDIYKRMRQRGLFAEPGRLPLIERVAALKQQHQLTSLDYELGSRGVAMLPAGDSYPSIDILVSPIQMNIQTLHDGDLLNFLGDLPTLGAGAFPISKCVVKLRSDLPNLPLAPKLDTQCNMLWVTLVDKRLASLPTAMGASSARPAAGGP